jgi:peptidoglycan/LPS O-acetylase OafA/YrhL
MGTPVPSDANFSPHSSPAIPPNPPRGDRLAWLEGIRALAAVWLLVYHAQLLFSDYAYTPQPTGLSDNFHTLWVEALPDLLQRWPAYQAIALPAWFGFQFVDVFVLISGFSLVLSLRQQPIQVMRFLRRRLMRILWPFWSVAWLSYPILWAMGTATNSYVPTAWSIFAGSTFPLVFDYEGKLLLSTSGPWWFVPLILSFAVLFPFLWFLVQRWGGRNLLLVSVAVTLLYRLLAVYAFDGHPTYVIYQTDADWQPFLLVLAKLSTFVVGMLVGIGYLRQRGPVFWTAQRALGVGFPLYLVGFLCQFDRLGWVVVDLLLPLGLSLILMVIFRGLASWSSPISTGLRTLGRHSYTYFLVHNFVVDRTVKLVIQEDAMRYLILLPVMILGTLVIAVLVDYIAPLLQRIAAGLVKDLDYVLSLRLSEGRDRHWTPAVGDGVQFQGRGNWRVLKVERLLDETDFWLCQISNGKQSLWVNEIELEPTGNSSDAPEVSSNR